MKERKNNIFTVLLFGLIAFNSPAYASFEVHKNKLMTSCMKSENNENLCACSVESLDKGLIKKMLTDPRTPQIVIDNIFSDMMKDWNAHVKPLDQTRKMSDLEGARFAIAMNNLQACQKYIQANMDIDVDLKPIKETTQEAKEKNKYDLEKMVGKQILKTDLTLNGNPFSKTEIKLKTFHTKDGPKKNLAFNLELPKSKLPQAHPEKEYYFDILINNEKIGRTTSWYAWGTDKNVIRITHSFDEQELDRLFALAPLGGKIIKFTNGYIDLEGTLVKE